MSAFFKDKIINYISGTILIALAGYILFTLLYEPAVILLKMHIREVELSSVSQQESDSYIVLKINGQFDFSNYFKAERIGREKSQEYFYAFHNGSGGKGFYVSTFLLPDEMKMLYPGRVTIMYRKKDYTDREWQALTGFVDIHEMNKFLLEDSDLFDHLKKTKSFSEKNIVTFLDQKYKKRFGPAGSCSFDSYLKLCRESDIAKIDYDPLTLFLAAIGSLFLIITALRRIIYAGRKWKDPLDGPFI